MDIRIHFIFDEVDQLVSFTIKHQVDCVGTNLVQNLTSTKVCMYSHTYAYIFMIVAGFD